MAKVLTKEQEQKAREIHAEVVRHGGLRAAARALSLDAATVGKHYGRALKMGLPKYKAANVGRVKPEALENMPLPGKGIVQRYIFTSAQNNTKVHPKVWQNLTALAAHYHAEIHVATFTYKKDSYGVKSVKIGHEATEEDKAPLWYAPEIEHLVSDDAFIVAPGLQWCGNMNILPTAIRPLSGLESYTGRRSSIVPHAKFAMASVPSGKFEGTKLMFTTGTVTLRNYIAKKEGLKAEFHHGYGGLLVEVTSDGRWYARQLNADSDGVIHDLTLRAKGGKVEEWTPSALLDWYPVEAINWGDIHVGTVAPEMMKLCWGEGGMLDTLHPQYQFMNDTLNWYARSKHDIKDPHKMFKRYVEGRDDVLAELKDNASFLDNQSFRPWCQTVVVDSNHDQFMLQWLREQDYKIDPKNAITFLEAQLAVYKAIRDKQKRFHLYEHMMRGLGVAQNIRFLRPDEGFIICQDANGGIECGAHGHRGANGARGSKTGMARMGRKFNRSHDHSAGIDDGTYTAGITGDLDQEYNEGFSSWSQSHVVTYANGKRAIITCWGGQWRAQ